MPFVNYARHDIRLSCVCERTIYEYVENAQIKEHNQILMVNEILNEISAVLFDVCTKSLGSLRTHQSPVRPFFCANVNIRCFYVFLKSLFSAKIKRNDSKSCSRTLEAAKSSLEPGFFFIL